MRAEKVILYCRSCFREEDHRPCQRSRIGLTLRKLVTLGTYDTVRCFQCRTCGCRRRRWSMARPR